MEAKITPEYTGRMVLAFLDKDIRADTLLLAQHFAVAEEQGGKVPTEQVQHQVALV
jgi:hypothetical protein